MTNNTKEAGRQGARGRAESQPEGVRVGQLERSDFEHVVLQISTYKGYTFLDIRKHMRLASGDLVPTRAGVTIPLSLYAEFKQLVLAAEAPLAAQDAAA